MAGDRSRHNSRKKAQLSLFDEHVLADMEPVKPPIEDAAPADPAPAAAPSLPAEISTTVHEPAAQDASTKQAEEKEAAIKAKQKKDQEARLAALWKARGKK